MGLCKCPKRQVTNQFCFEHRVNVCERCMVTSHPKCIIQSYLQWLKDSDYLSNCTLCDLTLDKGDCIRLTCYHVFHWDCLKERQAALPANTAPGGHCCPSCTHPIFPPANLVSPVADMLKQRLAQVNWGRNELDLPLLTDNGSEKTPSSTFSAATSSITKIHHSNSSVEKKQSSNGSYFNQNNNQTAGPHSVLEMDSNDSQANSRRPLLPRQSPIGGDRDDNKYKRRTPAEIFSRWSRRLYAPSSRPPWKRTWFLVGSGIFLFIIIIYLMASFGRSPDLTQEQWNPNGNQQHYD